MLFHTPVFFLFFFVFLVGFVLLKPGARIVYTTLASYFFYAWWRPDDLVWLLLLSGLGFFAALRAQKLSKPGFIFTLALILTPLVVFKYADFIFTGFSGLLGPAGNFPRFKLHLPLGISFITFTVIAYLVNVRRGIYSPEKSFFKTALYVAFFPHLIAGPIMRPHELFPQLEHLRLKKRLVKFGLLLFCAGMIKKVIFADQISPYVDRLFSAPGPHHFALSLFTAYAFSLQIYCDFSGYTDMALGTALVLGVKLPNNFKCPYRAESIRDFWRRWHITLSRWIRDYLYIPLGGSRHGPWRTAVVLLVTMLLAGLWHGASWTFVIWGGYYGILLIAEHWLEKLLPLAIPVFLKRLITFQLVAFGWILFRSRSWSQFLAVSSGLLVPTRDGAFLQELRFPLLLMVFFFSLHGLDRVSRIRWLSKRLPSALLYGTTFVVILSCLAFSVGNPNAFIYFDF